MSRSAHTEAQIIGAVKQVESGRKVEVTCPPVPSNIVTEFKLDSICRFAFI
jgi:hypothetical protein